MSLVCVFSLKPEIQLCSIYGALLQVGVAGCSQWPWCYHTLFQETEYCHCNKKVLVIFCCWKYQLVRLLIISSLKFYLLPESVFVGLNKNKIWLFHVLIKNTYYNLKLRSIALIKSSFLASYNNPLELWKLYHWNCHTVSMQTCIFLVDSWKETPWFRASNGNILDF